MRALPVAGLCIVALGFLGCPAAPEPGALARGCEEPASQTLDIDPGGFEPQIHPTAAWDGDALQVVWNGPRDGESGAFAVLRSRVWCDGTREAIQVVDAGDLANNVDPAVSVSSGRALVAWQSDDSSSPFNLSISTAALPLSGDPDRPWQPLEMQRGGDPYEGNAWMPRLADDEGGGFVLAGSRGIDSIGRFQSFLQTLDLDGEPFGPSEDVGLEFEVSQVEPAIAVRANRTRVLGWEERPDEGDDRVVWRELLPDGLGTATDTATLSAQTELGTLARVAVAVEQTPREAVVFVAHGGAGADLDITVEVVARGDGEPGPTQRLGLGDEAEHSPGIGLGPDGGAVVYYRLLSGLANELVVQPFRLDGDPDGVVSDVSMGDAITIETEQPVLPYPPSITNVGPGLWFLTWSEGTGTALRVRGRFLRID